MKIPNFDKYTGLTRDIVLDTCWFCLAKLPWNADEDYYGNNTKGCWSAYEEDRVDKGTVARCCQKCYETIVITCNKGEMKIGLSPHEEAYDKARQETPNITVKEFDKEWIRVTFGPQDDVEGSNK